MIAAFRYDETEMLDVERDVFDAFCSAPSKGRFFNRHIEGAHPWDKLVARPSR